MKTKKPDAQRVVERNLSPEPESMQKYSYEVRERIAKKAYELYEQRGRQAGRELEDWLESEELSARRWMQPVGERQPKSLTELFRSLADVQALLDNRINYEADRQVPAERIFTLDWIWFASSRHSGVRIGGI